MNVGDIRSDIRSDIVDRGEIAALLTAFYTRAYADDLLGTIFIDVAQMDLPAHIPVMCDFWETVLFRAGLYHGSALAVHRDLHAKTPLTARHFARWLELWMATVDERHAGPTAERAKLQAVRIAGAMSRRMTGEGLPV